MEETASPISPGPSTDSNALYFDTNPKLQKGIKLLTAFTVFMVLLSFIFCLVQGSSKNQTFYLLACNLVISSFVGVVNGWWYRRGELDADKFWFVILVAAVILFQCLVTDIVVFNLDHTGTPVTTPAPIHNITMMTIKTTSK